MHSKKELRKNYFLKMIVETHIATGEPVASAQLKDRYNLKESSALIRMIMSELEVEGYIEKPHISGGRIPSIKGYEYYANYLTSKNEEDLIEKLNDIFAKRRVSIDETLHEAFKSISELVGSTLVTSSDNSHELLKSIQLTELDGENSIVVLVTSLGRVESKILTINRHLIRTEDVRIAIRLFKERLIDTPLVHLIDKMQAIVPILRSQIKNYEALIQEFVGNIFKFNSQSKNNIYNKNDLILSREISRDKLAQVLDIIENNSIWETLDSHFPEDETLKIEIQPDKTSFISKKITFENSDIREISFVGTNRIDYNKALTAIEFIEDYLKKIKN
ncbi:heat-inducible transcriptional repressor HrcA [Candidatus Mycoplasma pogonae]